MIDDVNGFVIGFVDVCVAIILAAAMLICLGSLIFAFVQGVGFASLLSLVPVGIVIVSCSFWCVLSGIYHNTKKN